MTSYTSTFLKILKRMTALSLLMVFSLPAFGMDLQNEREDRTLLGIRFTDQHDHRSPIEWPDYGPDSSRDAHSYPPIMNIRNTGLSREQCDYLPEVIYHGRVVGVQGRDAIQ